MTMINSSLPFYFSFSLSLSFSLLVFALLVRDLKVNIFGMVLIHREHWQTNNLGWRDNRTLKIKSNNSFWRERERKKLCYDRVARKLVNAQRRRRIVRQWFVTKVTSSAEMSPTTTMFSYLSLFQGEWQYRLSMPKTNNCQWGKVTFLSLTETKNEQN